MRLETIRIRNYRSIQDCELTNCGGFNVVIGKNNSGKSNILSAINIFYTCIAAGNVVTLDAPIGKDIDFFERKVDHPVEINPIFEIALAERDELIRDIVTEAPQVKNAVDGLDPSFRLSVTLKIQAHPNFGFISKIALINPSKPDAQRILFELNALTAKEIQARLAQSRSRMEDVEVLRNLSPDLRRIANRIFERQEREGEVRPSSNYILDLLPGRYFSKSSRDLIREIQATIDESSSPDDFTRAIQTLITRTEEDIARISAEPLKSKVGTFSGEEDHIPKYISQLLARISEMKVLYLKERRHPIGREEASKLLSLKVTRGGPQVLRSIQETVAALLGVQIDAFQSGSPTRQESLQQRSEPNAEMDVDNFLADVNGSGIREALRIILDVEFENPTILLIEEPEIYLHPSLENSMMRYLKRVSGECQVFISTHSTNFLDTGEMKNVYLVSKGSSTKIQQLDFAEAETYIPRELGIRLSSLFMFDRLVFVEGPSDEAVLREWASTLKVNFGQQNVGFIHMGGVRNFTYFAAETTLAFLSKRQVKMWFIIDKDERDSIEITRLKELVGHAANVKVLEKRELENYLICPRALVEFITMKRTMAGHALAGKVPTEAEVRGAIELAVDELKPIALTKRLAKLVCQPVYPALKDLYNEPLDKETIIKRVSGELQRLIAHLQASESNIADVYDDQCSQLESQWAINKHSLVPGDALIDAVCKAFGVRFKKELDSARVAALMSDTEIGADVRSIIYEIGQ